MANQISDAIAPLQLESFQASQTLSIFSPSPAAGTAPGDGLPEGTYVDLNRWAADLMKLLPNPKYPWRDFKKAALEFQFDVEMLSEMMVCSLTNRVPPPSLAVFRAPSDGCRYRPIAVDMLKTESGAVSLKLLLARLDETSVASGKRE